MEVLIPLSFFAAMFGVFYLHYTSRNKERMALIEKGADANIFYAKKNNDKMPLWKILTLNIALLAMGVGVGLFIASALDTYTQLGNESVYAALIFLSGGAGLFLAYSIHRRDNDKDDFVD